MPRRPPRQAALKLQLNKTDANDALGLARIVRRGWYRDVAVKGMDAHTLRLLLVARAQLHNAHSRPGKVVIRYGFHPRCGETVVVTGRRRHGDGAALTIRQPDGSLAQLPVWMTEDQAAAMAVAEFPRLPLACLRELRLDLDACQSSLRDEGRRPGAGDKHTASATERPPTRPPRARGPTNAGGGRRAGGAVSAGGRAPDGGPRRGYRGSGGAR